MKAAKKLCLFNTETEFFFLFLFVLAGILSVAIVFHFLCQDKQNFPFKVTLKSKTTIIRHIQEVSFIFKEYKDIQALLVRLQGIKQHFTFLHKKLLIF